MKPDIEAQNYFNPNNVETFMDTKDIRQKFITKVYSILTAQIMFTTIVVATFMNIPELKYWTLKNTYLIWPICTLAVLGILLALTFSTSLRRTYPLNFLMLSLLTSIVSLETSALCVRSSVNNVYTSLFLTGGLFFILTTFAYLNLIDITNAGSVLCWTSIILFSLSFILIGISALFSISIKPVMILLVIAALILVSIYIVFDTQLILGRGEIKLSEEEYLVAAIFLYVDIISQFRLILTLLNEFNS